MKINFRVLSNKSIIYWLLLLFVPIEAINGILTNYGNVTINYIGYTYRAIIILYYFSKFRKKKYFGFFMLLTLGLFGIVCNSLVQSNTNFTYDLLLFIRILYCVTICIGVSDDVETNKLSSNDIYDIFDKSAYLLLIIYLISIILGSGFISYNGESGYKAFFNSINSLTCVCVVLSGFQIYQFFLTNRRKHLVLYILISLCIFLLGSKSGIVFWIIYLIYTLCVNLSIKGLKKIFLSTVVILIGGVILSNYFADEMQAIVARFLYFQGASSSNVEFMLSGRSTLLTYGYEVFNEKLKLWNVIIGKGAYNMQYLIGNISHWGYLKNVEMDFFDLFFFYGISGIALTYGLVFVLYKKNCNTKWNDGRKILLIICLLFSFLGGHIFMDSFGSTVLSLTLALNCGHYNNIKLYKKEV